MSQYLVLAENITFKNNKLSCINIYDKFSTVVMPAEFKFDMAIMCGPNWSVGEHKLAVKVKTPTGNEISVGELTVNIPNEDFVYNAYAQDLKVVMDYSIDSLTFIVYDNDQEVISRKYPVVSMLVPQKKAENQQEQQPANV
ncbi:hypothetical protein IJ750_06750 [bacterium]|nr:hypothetical protein [bacterium]